MKKQTIWITKYWQTKGIYSAEAEIGKHGLAKVEDITLSEKDYKLSEDEAEALIRPKAEKLIENLEAKITKLRNKYL